MRAQISIWLSMPLVWALDHLPYRVALRSEIEQAEEFRKWWVEHYPDMSHDDAWAAYRKAGLAGSKYG